MKILSFSTVESFISVAILDGRKTISKNTIAESGRHAELLVPELEKILYQNHIWYDDLDFVATVNGPASFTGVRIGLTVGRTIKLATNLPLVTVNSCEVMAFKYRTRSEKIITVIDAKMDDFFCAEFLFQDQKIIKASEPRLLKFEDLSKAFSQEELFFCGSGKEIAASEAKKAGLNFKVSEEEDCIEADLVGLLAYEKFSKKENSENLNPIYLRMPKISERKK